MRLFPLLFILLIFLSAQSAAYQLVFNDSNFSYYTPINLTGMFKNGTAMILNLNNGSAAFNYGHANANLCDLRVVWANTTLQYQMGIFIEENNSGSNGVSKIHFNASNVTADGGQMRLYYGWSAAPCVSDIKTVYSFADDFPKYADGSHAINSTLWTEVGTLVNDSFSPADYLTISNWSGANYYAIIGKLSKNRNQSELLGKLSLSTVSTVENNDIVFGWKTTTTDASNTVERSQFFNGTRLLAQYDATTNVSIFFGGEPAGSFFTFRFPFLTNNSVYYASDYDTLRATGLGTTQQSGTSVPIFGISNTNITGPTNYSGLGTSPGWTCPTCIYAQDGSKASSSFTGTGSQVTTNLIGTNYSFAIPADAEITGIKFVFTAYVPAGTCTLGHVDDSAVQLTKDGATAVGSNLGGGTWAAAGTRTYGADGQMWGTTWTVAEINSINFGALMRANIFDIDSLGCTAQVDSYTMTIFYRLPRPSISLDWIAVRDVDLNLPYPNVTFIGTQETSLKTVTTIALPKVNSTYNSTVRPFNVSVVGPSNSFTCNYTLNGVTNATNYTVVNSSSYATTWSLPFGSNYNLSVTCSNETNTDGDFSNFTIRQLLGGVSISKGSSFNYSSQNDTYCQAGISGIPVQVNFSISDPDGVVLNGVNGTNLTATGDWISRNVTPNKVGTWSCNVSAFDGLDYITNSTTFEVKSTLLTFIISPINTTYNATARLFNVTANWTNSSYTCNYTLNGITNATNFTVVNNTFYSASWTRSYGGYSLFTTCSNGTETATTSVNFAVRQLVGWVNTSKGISFINSTANDTNCTANIYGSPLRVNFTITNSSGAKIIDGINGTPMPDGNWSSGTFTTPDVGLWSCSIEAYDGLDTITNSTTFSVVSAEAPQISNITTNRGLIFTVQTGNTTYCQATIIDPDGNDTVLWANASITNPASIVVISNVNMTRNGSTWISQNFTPGLVGTWLCSISAYDGISQPIANGNFIVNTGGGTPSGGGITTVVITPAGVEYIFITPSAINASIELGKSQTTKINITNNGTTILEWSVDSTETWLSTLQKNGTIGAGQTISLSFMITGTRETSARLRFVFVSTTTGEIVKQYEVPVTLRVSSVEAEPTSLEKIIQANIPLLGLMLIFMVGIVGFTWSSKDYRLWSYFAIAASAVLVIIIALSLIASFLA